MHSRLEIEIEMKTKTFSSWDRNDFYCFSSFRNSYVMLRVWNKLAPKLNDDTVLGDVNERWLAVNFGNEMKKCSRPAAILRTVWIRKGSRLARSPFFADCAKWGRNTIFPCWNLCSLQPSKRIVWNGLKATNLRIGTGRSSQMRWRCTWIGWHGASGICRETRKSS